MEIALWCLFGFAMAKILSHLSNTIRSYLTIRTTEHDCLRLLSVLDISCNTVQSLRDTCIDDASTPEPIKNALKVQANIDAYTINLWKKSTIQNIINSYPVKYRNSIGYNDWDTAMVYLSNLQTKNTKKA